MGIKGDCCPTADALMLGCCSEQQPDGQLASGASTPAGTPSAITTSSTHALSIAYAQSDFPFSDEVCYQYEIPDMPCPANVTKQRVMLILLAFLAGGCISWWIERTLNRGRVLSWLERGCLCSRYTRLEDDIEAPGDRTSSCAAILGRLGLDPKTPLTKAFPPATLGSEPTEWRETSMAASDSAFDHSPLDCFDCLIILSN